MSQREIPWSQVRLWVSSLLAVLEALIPSMIGTAIVMSVVHLARGRRRRSIRWAVLSGSALGLRWMSLRNLKRFALGGPYSHTTTQRVRLVSANLWASTDDITPIASELSRMQADIVVLQEVTQQHLRRLDQLGTFARYRSKAVMPDHSAAGLGVWSSFELGDVEWINVADELQLRTWIEVAGGRRFRLYAIHAPAPVPSKVDRWHAWFSGMTLETSREMMAHNHPVVLAGDFNATVDHRQMRLLLRTGFRDSALMKRKGWRMTWNLHWRWLPALFRIDHVLVSRGASVATYRVGRGEGSDHRPVLVELTM
jgi:endonuclease/exonuclease/phosphatase family metal-dependent hydrolase